MFECRNYRIFPLDTDVYNQAIDIFVFPYDYALNKVPWTSRFPNLIFNAYALIQQKQADQRQSHNKAAGHDKRQLYIDIRNPD